MILLVVFYCHELLCSQAVTIKSNHEMSAVQRNKKKFVQWFTDSYIMPAIAAKGIIPQNQNALDGDMKAKIILKVKNAIVEEIADEPWLSFSYHFFWNPEASIEAMRSKIVGRIEKEITNYVKTQVDQNYPHQKDIAYVRHGRSVSQDEVTFIKRRTEEVILPTIQKLLNDYSINSQTMPRINVAISGGGTRATLGALGAISGLEEMGLLSAISSITTLSGSTWFLTPWVYSDLNFSKLKNKYFKPNLKNGLKYDFYADPVLVNLALQQKFKQPFTLVDFYGILLSDAYLRSFSDPFSFRLSQKSVDPLKRPFPILALASPVKEKMKKLYLGYEYFEVNPFEVGSYESSTYIPTWGFGRTYQRDQSIDFAIEMPAGKYLAMCGSAFLFSVKDMIVQNTRLSSLWTFYTNYFMPDVVTRLTDFRASPPKINDFIKGGSTKREFVDAGLLSNVASGLSFLGRDTEERHTDILILIDLSAGKMGGEYEKLYRYIKHKKDLYMPIPAPDKALGTTLMSVLGTPGQGPVILYFPLINNVHSSNFDIEKCKKNECDTFNFTYSGKTIDQLVDLMKKNIISKGHKDAIIKILKTVVDHKKNEYKLKSIKSDNNIHEPIRLRFS